MNHYNLAVIPGDGIGNEVMPVALDVLTQLGEMTGAFQLTLTHFDWGSDYYGRHGRMMPDDGLKKLESFDAIYFGAVGSPHIPDAITLRQLRLNICQSFDQYANIRPSLLLPGIRSPLRDKAAGDIDLVVVRENTEGEYTGAGGRAHRGLSGDIAVETSVFSRQGVERVIRYAFNLAQSRPRKKLSSVTKSNAQQHVFGFWDEIFEEVAVEFPDVTTERVLVDAMAAYFVLRPETLDVVVASNLHADILTDLGGAICGSLGMAASANLNPERAYPSMFEPVHGSAPDIVGKGIANPIGMVWSGAMMLDFLGEVDSAALILRTLQDLTADGTILTPDLGGNATTHEVGQAIQQWLKKST
jgi:tartrate dehydrogenase/decarboxylase/D-malate dehydrogenase